MNKILLPLVGLGVFGAAFASQSPPIQYNNGVSNLDALLATIRELESNGDYSITYGGGHFTDYSDHPFNTGQMSAVILSNGDISTAAGAYQILASSWANGKSIYGDFSPDSQTQWAVDKIRDKGAIGYIDNGNLSDTVRLLAPTWPSLTNNSFSRVSSVYRNYGGSQS